MTYKFNGQTIVAKPTDGKWADRQQYGIDQQGHPVYPAVREFEFKWNLLSIDEFNTIFGYYNTVSVTGTIAVDLPAYRSGSWMFQTYSGCTLQEPQVGAYFEEYFTDVSMLVLNVRTN